MMRFCSLRPARCKKNHVAVSMRSWNIIERMSSASSRTELARQDGMGHRSWLTHTQGIGTAVNTHSKGTRPCIFQKNFDNKAFMDLSNWPWGVDVSLIVAVIHFSFSLTNQSQVESHIADSQTLAGTKFWIHAHIEQCKNVVGGSELPRSQYCPWGVSTQ